MDLYRVWRGRPGRTEPPSRWDPVSGTYFGYAHVGDFEALEDAEVAARAHRTPDTRCFLEPVRWNEVEATTLDPHVFGRVVEGPTYEPTGPAERFEG